MFTLKGIMHWLLPSFCTLCHMPIQSEDTGFVSSELNNKTGGFLRGDSFSPPLNSTGYTARPLNTSRDFLRDNAPTKTTILKGERYIETKEKTLCQACWDAFPWHDGMACTRCAGSLSAGEICGECLQNAPPYHETICVFYYQKPIDSLILSLKFAEKLSHAKLMGGLMAEKLAAHYAEKEKPQCLIPVPLHPTRLRERGYNQALEIARPIAKKLSIPIQKTVCTRILPTLSQTSRNAKKRKKNMRNAFAIAVPFQAKYIAIVDDVLTTGSTVMEIARLFKKAGVLRIDVWCCAKTVLQTGGLMAPIS